MDETANSSMAQYPARRDIRLPPEILGRVFEHVRVDYGQTSTPLRFIIISHVSVYWRAVALGWSTLWASLTPEVAKKGLLDEFARRSGTMPLSIDIGTLSPSIYAHALATEHRRIQALTSDVRRGIVPLLGRPMPCLQRLRLCGEEYMFSVPDTGTLYNTLSGTLDMQDLELIYMSPKCFPWSTPFTSMRMLKLNGVGSAPPLLYTLTDVVEALRRMSALEHLQLQMDMPPYDRDVAYEDLYLPKLQSVGLGGQSNSFLLLWSLLVIPPDCSTMLDLNLLTLDTGLLHSAWGRYLASLDTSDFDDLIIESPVNKLQIRIRSMEKSITESHLCLSVQSWEMEPGDISRLVASLVSMIPVKDFTRGLHESCY